MKWKQLWDKLKVEPRAGDNCPAYTKSERLF